jgi:hypothetical protein
MTRTGLTRIQLLVGIIVIVFNLIPTQVLNAQTNENWTLPFTLTIFGQHRLLEIAVNSQSSNNFEFEYDLAAPPQPPLGLYIYIQNDSQGPIFKYLKSTVPPNYPLTWQLVIKSITINSKIFLEWDAISNNISENFELTLSNSTHNFIINDSSKISLNLETGKTYYYTVTARQIDSGSQPTTKPTKPINYNPAETAFLNLNETTELILTQNFTDAAYILSETIQPKTSIIINLLKSNNTETVAHILNIANKSLTNEVFPNLDPNQCAKVILLMSELDLQDTAHKVEDAVKYSILENNETIKKEKIKNISKSLIKMDNESIIELLSSIAKLPETPSTVSRIFEHLDSSETALLLHFWLQNGDYTGLSDVIGFLSDEYLLSFYPLLNSKDRYSLRTILPIDSILTINTLNSAQIQNVSLNYQSLYYVGDNIPVNITISNTGVDSFNFLSPIVVDSKINMYYTEYIQENSTLSYPLLLNIDTSGNHTLNIGSHSLNLSILPIPIPIIQYLDISLSNDRVLIGDVFNVTSILNNIGDSGSSLVIVYLDGKSIFESDVHVEGNTIQNLTFPLSLRSLGRHTIQVGDISVTFSVEKPSYNLGWYLFVLAFSTVILAMIAKARDSL